jgi:hypothetical protein
VPCLQREAQWIAVRVGSEVDAAPALRRTRRRRLLRTRAQADPEQHCGHGQYSPQHDTSSRIIVPELLIGDCGLAIADHC